MPVVGCDKLLHLRRVEKKRHRCNRSRDSGRLLSLSTIGTTLMSIYKGRMERICRIMYTSFLGTWNVESS